MGLFVRFASHAISLHLAYNKNSLVGFYGGRKTEEPGEDSFPFVKL